MEQDRSPYVYSRIQPDEFRVLRITAVSPLVAFHLETFSIYDAPEYEALSYAWGTAPAEEEAICNGARFLVTRTLAEALRRVYAHSGSGWVWVDAICINQADDVEKAHQVAGMGEVYSCADKVLVWLGEAADQSDLACALLPDLTERIWALRESEGGWRPLSAGEFASRKLPPPDDLLWRAAFLLYGRAWFQRLWIVQEIVLARDVVFLCGAQKLDWHVLVNFAVATARSVFVSDLAGLHVAEMGDDQGHRAPNGMMLIRNANKMRAGLETPEKEADGLDSTMNVMMRQRAFLRVDYVYAVRGMLPDDMREKVVVDYSDQVKQNYGGVFASFFRQCLQRLPDWPSRSFPPKSASTDIPSWCPPWGSGANWGYLPVVGCRAGRPTRTSFLHSFIDPSPKTDDDNGRTLRIAGISVAVFRDIIPLDPIIEQDMANRLHTRLILDFLKDCSAYIPNCADGHQRFLGVLVGECDWLETSDFAGCPDGNLLDSLCTFLEPLAEHEEHEGKDGFVPYNLDGIDYVMGQHRFWRKYLNRIILRWKHRSFGVTTDGRMALVSCDTKPGDTLCLFLGATLPQVVSRQGDGVHWRYIGPSIVDGIMKGEIFDTMEGWMNKKDIFCLR